MIKYTLTIPIKAVVICLGKLKHLNGPSLLIGLFTLIIMKPIILVMIMVIGLLIIGGHKTRVPILNIFMID